MANRYWVTGGTGNWDSTTNWATTSGGASGASVPGSSDAALLDASSGAGTVTLDISPTIQILTCTGFTGTLAFGTNTISLNSTGTIFAGSTTMTVTGTPQIICTNSSATSRTLAPTVVTEANSISFRIIAGTGGFTTSTGSYRDLDFTDGVNSTGFAGALGGASPTIYGNFKASTGMTQNASTSAVIFAATSGTKTLTLAGVTFDRPFTFNGIGGTFQLQDNLTMGSTRTVTLTNGTLDLNNQTLSTGLFSSSNSNIRSIAFGTGNITLTGNNTTIFTTTDVTNLTYTGTPTVNFTYAGSTGTRQISSASTNASIANVFDFNFSAGSDSVTFGTGTARAANNVNFTGFSGTIVDLVKNIYGSLTLAATNLSVASTAKVTFKATSGTKTVDTAGLLFDFVLDFDGVGGTWSFVDALTQGPTRAFTITNGTVKLKSGVTSTVGSFVANSSSVKYLQSTTPGSQATISQASGTITVSDLTIQDSNATGGASWTAYADYENVDAGNNDGWNFSLSPPYASYEPPIIIRSFTQPRRF